MSRRLIVDTIPKNARNQGSVNLGLEIAAGWLGAERCHWLDFVGGPFDVIAFNVFYPTHLLNIWPFLYNHEIEPLWKNRFGKGPVVIAGGQGVGTNGILGHVADHVFLGEVDGDCIDEKGMWRMTKLETEPCVKQGKAAIELTRGCKYRCRFCEYGWVHGGKYREKPFELVCKQVEDCQKRGVTRVNFMSANFGGYSRIEELLAYCDRNGVNVLNCDTCLRDVRKMYPLLKNNYLKLGLESFDEKTRASIGKPISDVELDQLLDELLLRCSGIHFYLIYGLPGDDYDRWFVWLEKLASKRVKFTDRNIRYELSITNLEPCLGTPLENAPIVDFEKKHVFLRRWGQELIRLGFHKGEQVWYENCGGRFGRKEDSYRLLMALKRGGPELTHKLLSVYPSGVSRSIKDSVAARFFDSSFKPRMPLTRRSFRDPILRLAVQRIPVRRIPVKGLIRLCRKPCFFGDVSASGVR